MPEQEGAVKSRSQEVFAAAIFLTPFFCLRTPHFTRGWSVRKMGSEKFSSAAKIQTAVENH
jgi:hypothetical protein